MLAIACFDLQKAVEDSNWAYWEKKILACVALDEEKELTAVLLWV